MPSTARKTNTPARAIRIVMPAPRERPAKMASPRRVEDIDPPSSSGGMGSPAPPVNGLLSVTASSFLTYGDPCRSVRSTSGRTGQGSSVSPGGSGSSASGDLGDDVLRLRRQRGVERSGTGLGGGGLLALVADHVAQVALHERRRVGVVVGRAGEGVRRKQERVGALVGDGAVDRDGHVVGAATLGGRRGRQHLGSTVGRRLVEVVADLDRRDAEGRGLALVGVPDGPVA